MRQLLDLIGPMNRHKPGHERLLFLTKGISDRQAL
jgi:hypothetical protein